MADHVVVATSAYSGWLGRLSSLFVPVYDYALVVRSADARAARRRSAGSAARGCPTRATSSTTSGSPPTTGSCGAATTRSTTRTTGSGRSSTGGRRRSTRLDAPVPARVPAARGPRLPVPLGRRDRHDLAVHGHVRAGARRPADVRPRLHRAGRRGEPLGGRRRPRLHPPSGLGPAPARLRPEPAVPLPARAAPVARRQRGPPRARPGRPERGPPAACSGRSTRWGSASTARTGFAGRRARRPSQAGVVTQFGSSRDSVASGSDPWASTWSWNSRRSNPRAVPRGRSRRAAARSRGSRSCR